MIIKLWELWSSKDMHIWSQTQPKIQTLFKVLYNIDTLCLVLKLISPSLKFFFYVVISLCLFIHFRIYNVNILVIFYSLYNAIQLNFASSVLHAIFFVCFKKCIFYIILCYYKALLECEYDIMNLIMWYVTCKKMSFTIFMWFN